MCEDKAELILVAPLFPLMVPTDTTTEKWAKFCAPQNRQNTISTMNLKEAQANYHDVGGIRIVQEHLTSALLLQTTADITVQSWHPVTTKQYGSYLKRWVQFCYEQNILAKLDDEGFSYSAINTVKSRLSSMFESMHKRDIGKDVLLIKRFIKERRYPVPA